jgi:hypothetical protein
VPVDSSSDNDFFSSRFPNHLVVCIANECNFIFESTFNVYKTYLLPRSTILLYVDIRVRYYWFEDNYA